MADQDLRRGIYGRVLLFRQHDDGLRLALLCEQDRRLRLLLSQPPSHFLERWKRRDLGHRPRISLRVIEAPVRAQRRVVPELTANGCPCRAGLERRPGDHVETIPERIADGGRTVLHRGPEQLQGRDAEPVRLPAADRVDRGERAERLAVRVYEFGQYLCSTQFSGHLRAPGAPVAEGLPQRLCDRRFLASDPDTVASLRRRAGTQPETE